MKIDFILKFKQNLKLSGQVPLNDITEDITSSMRLFAENSIIIQKHQVTWRPTKTAPRSFESFQNGQKIGA